MITVSLSRVLINGALFSAALSAYTLWTIALNPRLWRHDAPKAMQPHIPELTDDEKRVRGLVFVPLLILMFGLPILSAYLLRQDSGGTLSFLSAYLHIAGVLLIFNIVDAVVLDYLIIGVLRPRFVVIPEVESMWDVMLDVRWQFVNFLKGVVFCVVFSFPLALAAMVL